MNSRINGVNVIGHVFDASGLGNTARLFMRAMLENGVQVAALDVDNWVADGETKVDGVQYCSSVSELPYTHNIIVVSVHILSSLWRNRVPEVLNGKFINIGLFFWEVQVIPKAWIPAVEMFDALMVCSGFVRSAIELAIPSVPTLYAEHPLEKNMHLYANEEAYFRVREDLGILPSEVLFAASFDLRSNFERKNPLAILQAFEIAFDNEPRARLMLKASGLSSQKDKRVLDIIAKIKNNPKIILIEKSMDYLDVMRLYNACDVFVSLHRSEGLGLGPLEAMLMGKAVLATGYSGNMAYMNEHNAILVDYKLVKPMDAGWMFSQKFCGPGGYWAEPDLRSATQGMKTLFSDANLRQHIGSIAKGEIQHRQLTAWAGKFIDGLSLLNLKPKSLRASENLRRKMVLQEILNPVLRRKNIVALRNHLRKKFQ